MSKDYIIYAPPCSKSNGSKVLYKFAELLKKRGFNAYIFARPQGDMNIDCVNAITSKMRNEAVIIYPEVVNGNPLQFRNVVRFVLYYPGVLGGERCYHNSEVVFTFDKKYIADAPVLFIPTLESELFYSDDTPKDTTACFVYKRGKWKDVPELKDCVEINAKYPEKREDLAKLLRRTHTLYSYDNCTILLDEALLCGCDVKIITEDGFEDYQSDYSERLKHFESQLDYFIEVTQKMDYKGEIQPLTVSYRLYLVFTVFKYFIYKYILRNKEKAQKYYYRSRRYL